MLARCYQAKSIEERGEKSSDHVAVARSRCITAAFQYYPNSLTLITHPSSLVLLSFVCSWYRIVIIAIQHISHNMTKAIIIVSACPNVNCLRGGVIPNATFCCYCGAALPGVIQPLPQDFNYQRAAAAANNNTNNINNINNGGDMQTDDEGMIAPPPPPPAPARVCFSQDAPSLQPYIDQLKSSTAKTLRALLEQFFPTFAEKQAAVENMSLNHSERYIAYSTLTIADLKTLSCSTFLSDPLNGNWTPINGVPHLPLPAVIPSSLESLNAASSSSSSSSGGGVGIGGGEVVIPELLRMNPPSSIFPIIPVLGPQSF
jgi:hypothetical protein